MQCNFIDEVNVQPVTGFRGLNEIYPSYWYSRLVIQAIEGFVLNRVDNRIVLSLIYVSLRDLDAHTATLPATYQVIICHLLLGLSGSCQESRLLREQAKKSITNFINSNLQFHLLTISSGPSHECL